MSARPEPSLHHEPPSATDLHAESRAGEIRRLSTLLEASQALSRTLDLRSSLAQVLDILKEHHDAIRSSVLLRREDVGGADAARSDELQVHASDGLESTTRFRLGEGITGRVVETGQSVVVPRVARDTVFGRRGGSRPALPNEETSTVSVPILHDGRAIGALSVDLRFKPERTFDRTLKFLGIVASMVAQAVMLQRFVAAEQQRLVDENTDLRQKLCERYDFSNILGTSGPMRQVCEQMAQVARSNATVLIRGESGTGKELIAHAIHYNSHRAQHPFIKVSCAALPETLIESELFGYEKGAFTGANAQKKGRFDLAAGGTLFLDEIGDVNLATQVKLLRVLQAREFERVGGVHTIQTNVRLITATNMNLEKAIADGAFREDLYYRLNVFTLFVPPLRERKSDLLLMADHFLEKLSRAHGKSIRRISTPAIDMLMSYHWPGNVRELENAIERAVLVCEGQVVHGHHLPPTLQTAEASGTVTRVSLRDSMATYEKDLILDALKTSRGNRAKAARLLSTTQRILNYKVSRYGIDWRRFRG